MGFWYATIFNPGTPPPTPTPPPPTPPSPTPPSPPGPAPTIGPGPGPAPGPVPSSLKAVEVMGDPVRDASVFGTDGEGQGLELI